MSLKDKIQTDLKTAFKQKNSVWLETIKYVLAQIKNEEIAKQAELTDEQIIKLLQSELKKRQAAIKLFEQNNRQELVKEEEEKLNYLKDYLPQQLEEKELKNIVKEVLSKNPEQKNNFGFLMKEILGKVSGRANGSQVASILKKLL